MALASRATQQSMYQKILLGHILDYTTARLSQMSRLTSENNVSAWQLNNSFIKVRGFKNGPFSRQSSQHVEVAFVIKRIVKKFSAVSTTTLITTMLSTDI